MTILLVIFEKLGNPFLLLFSRLWIAQIFWDSGLSKIQSWDTTVLLFANEYKVPYISPELAAYLTVGAELICPVLLVIGLGTRLAVIPMLVITAVIQLTYLHANEHIYWAFLLGFILCNGPGTISLDFLIRHWFGSRERRFRFC